MDYGCNTKRNKECKKQWVLPVHRTYTFARGLICFTHYSLSMFQWVR